MKKDRFLWEHVCMNIYRQMYQEAEPSANFDDLMNDGITTKQNWFMEYYLSTERQTEIIEDWCKEFRCDKTDKRKVKYEILLGSSPRSVKK